MGSPPFVDVVLIFLNPRIICSDDVVVDADGIIRFFLISYPQFSVVLVILQAGISGGERFIGVRL